MKRLLVAALIVVSGALQAADQGPRAEAPKQALNPVALGVAVQVRRLLKDQSDVAKIVEFYNESTEDGKQAIIDYMRTTAPRDLGAQFWAALAGNAQSRALSGQNNERAAQPAANRGLTALQILEQERKELAQKEKEKKADVAFQQQLLNHGQVTKDQQVAQQLQAEEKAAAARERERKKNAAQRPANPQGQNGNGQMRVQQPTAPLRDFSLREEEQKALFADQEREIAAALAGDSAEALIALANKYPNEVERIDKRIAQLLRQRYPSEPSAPESPRQQVRPPDPQRNEILINGGGDELSQEELLAIQRNGEVDPSQADLETQIAVAESSCDIDALLRLQRKYANDAIKLSIIQGAIDRLGKELADDAPQNQADDRFRGEAFNLGNPSANGAAHGAVYQRDPRVQDGRNAFPDGAGPDDAKPDSLWKQIKKFVKDHPAETTAVGVVAAAGGALLYKNYKTKQ